MAFTFLLVFSLKAKIVKGGNITYEKGFVHLLNVYLVSNLKAR